MKRRSTKRKASLGATNHAKKRLQVREKGICQTPDIGKDLMFEVLVRLSIKSLLRFKTVSKYWFRLISSPEFIKFRLRNACDDPNLSHHKVLFIESGDSEVSLLQVPLYPTLCDPHSYGQLLIEISHPMKFWEEESRRGALTFVGSCSGLVCIAGLNHRVIVWNPALRKCKSLPYFGHGSPVSYGFGYDEASDDFKVVGIRTTPKTMVKIYSARTNSWKKLQEDGFVVDQVDGHGCLLNGKLHWAINRGIFTIDLSSECFGVIEPPDCVRGRGSYAWSVHAAGKFLAVFCFYSICPPTMSTADLWMMERYGVKESWTRINDDCTDPRQKASSVYKEGSFLCRRLFVTPSKPSKAWQMIPTPGHMTGNGISAFLLNSFKQYTLSKFPYFYPYFWSFRPVVVYLESLTWPYM